MLESKLIVWITVAFSAIVGVGAASAADVAARPHSETPIYVQPGHDWTGLYLGANIGFGLGRSADTSTLGTGGPVPFADTVRSNMNGVVGGAQIGYDWQAQNWLWGVEADFQGTGQRSNHSFTCPAGLCIGPLPINLSQQLDWFGTVRGRAGFLVSPNVLLYATGGLAYGQVDSRSTLAGAPTSNIIHAGWTVGGGIEGLISENWTARLEYLFVDLGTISDTLTTTVGTFGGAPLITGFNSRVTDNIVRVSVNYKLGGPVIPNY